MSYIYFLLILYLLQISNCMFSFSSSSISMIICVFIAIRTGQCIKFVPTGSCIQSMNYTDYEHLVWLFSFILQVMQKCTETIPSQITGYCLCGDLWKQKELECNHRPISCRIMCNGKNHPIRMNEQIVEDGEQQRIATIDPNGSLPRTWHAMISFHPTTVVYFTIQFNHSFQVIACVLEEEERGTATVDIANSLVVSFVPLCPNVIAHEFKATNTFKSQPS